MFHAIPVLLGALVSTLKTRQQLFFESLALRHQVQVLNRKMKRPDLRAPDRLLWVVLSKLSAAWKSALVIVQPETVIRWHRTAFRTVWRWKSRPRAGRPRLTAERYTPVFQTGIRGAIPWRPTISQVTVAGRRTPHTPHGRSHGRAGFDDGFIQ